jgi:hypothetical protein
MGDTRRQVGTMQEDAVRPSDTAATVGDGIVEFLVFRLQLLSV